MKSPATLLLVLFPLAATAALAQDKRTPDVGDTAPEITDADFVLNAPAGKFSLERYRGKVVLIQQWWFPCSACRSTFSWLEERYREFHDQGLEIFAFEQMSTRGPQGEQQASKEAILALIQEQGGVSYPVSRGGTVREYRGSFEFPYFWLLDSEGKVVFHEEAQGAHYQTTRAKLLELIPQLLARIKTPKFGGTVDEAFADAVEDYDAGRYDDALRETDKVASRAKDGALDADAETLRAAIAGRGRALLEAAERQVAERQFAEAIDLLSWTEDAFGKTDTGQAAKDRRKELESDKAVKQELKAMKQLDKILAKIGTQPDERGRKALQKFIKANAGTAAAERAERLLE